MLVSNGPLDEALLVSVREHYPGPIAQAARRFQAAPEDDCLDEALHLGQTLVVTLGTISLAWCRHRHWHPKGVLHWHEKFARSAPSLGDWLSAARGGADLASRVGAPLSGFEAALGREDNRLLAPLEAMVKLRNIWVRAPATNAPVRLSRLREYGAHLRAALLESAFLVDAQLVLVEGSERQRRGGFTVRVRGIVGDNPIFLRRQPFSSPEALYSRTVYLLQEVGDDIEMAPFWIARENERGSGWDLYFLNKRIGERFEYRNFLMPGDSVLDGELPTILGWFDHGPAAERFRQAPGLGRPLASGKRTLPTDRIHLAWLYRQTMASMVESISVDAASGDKGWNHNLNLRPITAVSTAIGLRIVRLVAADFSPFRRDELLETLWRRQLPGGLWTSASQLNVARPEATSTVLLAICNEGDWERAMAVRTRFETLLEPYRDQALWQHVWSMALVVPALSTLDPDSEILAQLVKTLEEAAIREKRERIIGWGRFSRMHPAFDDQAGPSAALTARVLLALRHCRDATDGRLGPTPVELEHAVRWLLREPTWQNTVEEIERPLGGNHSEKLLVRHFTGPWAVRALLEFDVDPDNERIGGTVHELYTSHRNGLWDWSMPGRPTITRPTWATLDALRALETYACRAARVPPERGASVDRR
jgi:hypothetical protein